MSTNRRPDLKLVRPGTHAAAAAGGRVRHDSRGNAVWDWAIATGVLAKKTVAELITTLDGSDTLTLDDDLVVDPEQIGDPYNRTVRVRRPPPKR